MSEDVIPFTPDKTHIGFIGLGVMGSPMAHNLLRQGYALTVHDRSAAAQDAVAAAGGQTADSPQAVAAAVDLVITMLPDTAIVEQVLLGKNGVMAGARSGTVVVDMSTISPLATRRFSAELAAVGVSLLDAPVSGGQEGARSGKLAIMVGGPETTFQRCRPVFDVLGAKIVYMGNSGAGQVTKTCNQIVIGVTIAALGEALTLARRMDVDPARVREALLGGAGGSEILARKGPRMLNDNYAPGFRTALHHKDLGIALEAGRATGVPLLATALVQQLMQAAISQGYGDADNTVLARLIDSMSGA